MPLAVAHPRLTVLAVLVVARGRAQKFGSVLPLQLRRPIDRGRYVVFALPELAEVGRRLSHFDVFHVRIAFGYRIAIATMPMALVPLPRSIEVIE